MEPDVFVEKLKALAPSASDLEKSGFSREEAARLVESFICVKRKCPLPILNGSDQLLQLLRQWDLSKVEIGMIRFPEPPTQVEEKVFIGSVEADPMVIQCSTGEIAVQESGTKEHVLWPVAKNGSMLLDAMLIAARFLEMRGSGEIDFDDDNAAQSVALECAAATGGNAYLDFYKMLLGAA